MTTALTTSQENITVGKLGRPRGLDGEIYVSLDTDFPDRFENLKEILVSTRTGWETLKIDSVRTVSGRPVLKFADIETPEQAARLTNRILAVTKSDLVIPPSGSYYIFDLVGCRVYDSKSGDDIGEIVDVEQYPANDVFVIDTKDRQVRVPAVKVYVKEVNVKEKRVLVDISALID